jgi:predicted glycosyltransferase
MRILIDILHPAHVHFFRHFYAEMTNRGHEVYVTARAKECSIDLLERYDLPYELISVQKSGAVGLSTELVQRTFRLLRAMRKFRPTVLTGIMGPSIALAGSLGRVPAIVFYDTEFATQSNWFVYPLAHSVCTPDCYQGRVRGHHVTYPGYHELAYLHPNRFAPDTGKLESFGLHVGEPYSLVRFVSWQAVHDRSERGLSIAQKREIVSLLEKHGRVLISAESDLPSDLDNMRVRGAVDDIHHLLAHAQTIVGESATMSSEAAVLGVPAVFIATTGRGYTDDQERRYGLVHHFTEDRFDDAIRTLGGIFTDPDRLEAADRSRQRLLEDKIDVTEWMVDFFENNFEELGAPSS